jgi:homoserine O-acetyltransferase
MALDIPFYTAEAQGPYDLVSIGRFELEEGGVIPDLQLAVATFGTLAEDKNNAILIPTWFSGTHATWAQAYIGPGRALDPERYFIVVVNQIGNGLSTSPHNADDPSIAMSKFPHVRIGDDVRAQEQLLREHFGIERLALVVGGSMGAQQTWEWAVRFPDKVVRAAPIAGTAQNTPHDFLFTRTLLDAITSDPGFNGGEYAAPTDVIAGLHRHADIWATMGLTTDFWKTEFWRGIPPLVEGMQFETYDDFQERLHTAALRVDGPQRPAHHGLEVATRRRRPQRRWRPRGGARPDHRAHVRHAYRAGHVLPAARLCRRAEADTGQRTAGAALDRRALRAVRLRAVLSGRGRRESGRVARDHLTSATGGPSDLRSPVALAWRIASRCACGLVP